MKIAILGLGLVLTPAVVAPTMAFDRATLDATKACHDHVWFKDQGYNDLPNAAISAFPGSVDGENFVIFWNVRWDDPKVRAAGSCTVKMGKIEAFEDYTKDP